MFGKVIIAALMWITVKTHNGIEPLYQAICRKTTLIYVELQYCYYCQSPSRGGNIAESLSLPYSHCDC